MKCEYYGPVKGQARPRFTHAGSVYDAPDMKAYKAAIRRAWVEQAGECYEGPIVVKIHAYRPMPKSTPRSVERLPWTCKPDADNIAKAVLDALTGVAWHDDKQVVRLEVTKHDRTRDVAEGLYICVGEAGKK